MVKGGTEFASDGYPHVANPRINFRLVHFGRLIRQFHNTTFVEFDTVVFPHKARKASSASRKRKALKSNAYKFHSPSDHVRMIELSDCTDPFSIQLVSVYLQCVWVSIDPDFWGNQHLVLSIAFTA